MKRILFFILSVFILVSQAQGAVEIYANGHKFDSLGDYIAWKKSVAQNSSAPSTLSKQQEDYIRQMSQQLGIKLDINKVKTFQIGHQNLFDGVQHRLYVLGIENGMASALQDFYAARGGLQFHATRQILPDQLQEAIQEAVTASRSPKLLISEPGKMRIMAISTDNSDH